MTFYLFCNELFILRITQTDKIFEPEESQSLSSFPQSVLSKCFNEEENDCESKQAIQPFDFLSPSPDDMAKQKVMDTMKKVMNLSCNYFLKSNFHRKPK